jgi:polysaccharide chain length determinant protein (PEP-CTERM system associated)
MNSDDFPVSRPQFSPLSIIRALWKWKVVIIVVWLLGSAASILIVRSLPAVYVADALIQVDPQKIPETFVPTTVATAIEVRMDRLKQQVLSRERLWSLVQELDLYREERRVRTQEEVIELMRNDISINLESSWSAREQPSAFRVHYSAPEPALAAAVTNRIAAFFVDENLRQREAEAQDASEFLRAQLTESDRQLQAQEAKLKEFKLSNVGGLPEQEAALLATMSQNRTELSGIQEALARARQNKIVIENSKAMAEVEVRDLQDALRPPGSSIQQRPSLTALDQLDLELRAARLRYLDTHPEVERLLREKKRVEDEMAQSRGTREGETKSSSTDNNGTTEPAIAGRVRLGGDGTLVEQRLLAEKQRVSELLSQIEQVTSEMEMLEARRQEILKEVAETQVLLKNIPVREQQLASIMRDYDTSKRNYDSLLNKKLSADVAAKLEKGQKAERFVLLEGAQIPEKPEKPKKLPLTAGGVFCSLIVGAATAFLLELKRNVILGEWELPAGTVVLGRIPRIEIT